MGFVISMRERSNSKLKSSVLMFGGLVVLLVVAKRGAQLSILKRLVCFTVLRICGLTSMMGLMLLSLMSFDMTRFRIRLCLL